jgi:hypothetical protein
VALWMTIIWHGWPFTGIRNPLLEGLSLLIGYYLVTHVAFRTCVGMFEVFSVVGFFVTAAAVMFLTLHFDLWPLSRYPAVMRQPVLGLVWTAIALLLGGIAYAFCANVLGMAPLVVLTTLAIPFIFGSIVVLNMLGGSLFARLSQPAKGAASVAVAATVGSGLSLAYGSLAPVLTGAVNQGPPAYAFEIWLASALLAVTLPFLDYHAGLFELWPFAARREENP